MNPADRIQLLSQLRVDEGFRQHPYRDTVGRLTIGYGRNLEDRGLTRPEAEHLLANDIELAEEELRRAFWWYPRLDPQRQAVLVNMAVNLGLPRLRTFKKTIAALAAADYAEAAAEMLDSKWATQVGQRAVRLADQMRHGRWA